MTLEIICRYIESPHKEVITCCFNKQAVTLDFHGSLTAMAPQAGKRPALKGVLAGRKVFYRQNNRLFRRNGYLCRKRIAK